MATEEIEYSWGQPAAVVVCQMPMYPTEMECALKALVHVGGQAAIILREVASPEFCVAPRGA